MKAVNLLWITLLFLGACAKEDIRNSVSHSLAGACRTHPESCTYHEGDQVLDGKGVPR